MLLLDVLLLRNLRGISCGGIVHQQVRTAQVCVYCLSGQLGGTMCKPLRFASLHAYLFACPDSTVEKCVNRRTCVHVRSWCWR